MIPLAPPLLSPVRGPAPQNAWAVHPQAKLQGLEAKVEELQQELQVSMRPH